MVISRLIFKVVGSWVAMVSSYPEFHGGSDEDVEDFLENMDIRGRMG